MSLAVSVSAYPIQPLDDKTKKELETVLKGFVEPKQVIKLDTKVFSHMTCV